MKTLIELYDEKRPMENVIAAEVFRPHTVIYMCADNITINKKRQRRLRDYFAHRNIDANLIFIKISIFDVEAIVELFRKLTDKYTDCAIDITGGTDAILFAAGLFCAEKNIPIFTYSRRKNRFYNIRNAAFAEGVPCEVIYQVEDCFLMAGGAMRTGRVDNRVLWKYLDDIEPFIQLYMKYRKKWVKIVTYIQRVSQVGPDTPIPLEVHGEYTVKGDHASRIPAPEEALQDLAAIDFIRDLKIEPEVSVSFTFRDTFIRTWLRDVGSVLELYMFKACFDTGIFDDVVTSAIVDWDAGSDGHNAVSNELDVMCTRGVTTVFISCKACEVKTEALNELSILRNRFGGDFSKAAIVTTTPGGGPMRNRAHELDIVVIDLNDIKEGRVMSAL